MKKVIEASQAVAEGVNLCKPGVVPMFPITPQTHIVENLAELINNGILDAEMIHVESEHSAISAASGASAVGVRTFTATSSQGLALMNEILHVVSGMRQPVVMAVANRALSAPINIWNDHQDTMSARDTGWIQIYVESSQEALDSIIQAFKIAENKDVFLPCMVCLDGFTLTHVYEPVNIPMQGKVNTFLPKFKPIFSLNPKKPVTMGPVAFPDSFIKFKHNQKVAMDNSLNVIKKVNSDFKSKFGRSYGTGLIEQYKMEGAKTAIVCLGTIAGTARVVVDKLRKSGKKVGLIRIRTFRPFPEDELIDACKKLDNVAVIDRSFSFGHKGAVAAELESALTNNKKPIIHSFIEGLGGKDVTPEDIEKLLNKSINAKKAIKDWNL